MFNVRLIGKDGREIDSVGDWLIKAPPAKGEEHWKDGRSAKELAKAWIGSGKPSVPREFQELAEQSPCFSSPVDIDAIAEKPTRLDHRSGPRYHDLLLRCVSNGERVVVGIEAKADEPFSSLVKDASNQDRASELSSAIFGHNRTSELRYQLLYGVAATLIEAKEYNAKCGVFLVHEFIHDGLSATSLERNQGDYNTFVTRLFNLEHADSQRLLGPIRVPGNAYVPSDVDLYVAKISTQVGHVS